MPVQSRSVPGSISGVVLGVVDAAAIVGTRVVGVGETLSVTVNTLNLPAVDSDTEHDRVVVELEKLDITELVNDELEEDVDVDEEVNEVAIPKDAEATKSQSNSHKQRTLIIATIRPSIYTTKRRIIVVPHDTSTRSTVVHLA
jgi:hypothetical protein